MLRPAVECVVMLWRMEGRTAEWAWSELEAMQRADAASLIGSHGDDFLFPSRTGEGRRRGGEVAKIVVKFLALTVLAGIETFDSLERKLPALMGNSCPYE